jgi:hypothetical protein
VRHGKSGLSFFSGNVHPRLKTFKLGIFPAVMFADQKLGLHVLNIDDPVLKAAASLGGSLQVCT